MIIGGYAVAFHGFPRFTVDIDLLFDAAPENVARLRRALVDFAFAESDLPQDAFRRMGNILSFGVAPSRVDLLKQIDGVEFAAARPNCVRGKYGTVEVTYIGRDDLIRNKSATSPAQDSVDASNLHSGKDIVSD